MKMNPVSIGAKYSTKALSTLTNPSKILPVALIEVATTVGRTYQGYKRGGEEEARERICEESTSAVFWLFGAKALNKVGDFIGKKLGIEYLDIDVGRDELRCPSLNIPKKSLTKTSLYKFGKILGSAAIATAFIGIVLPKLNHKITNAVRKANGLEPIPEKGEKKKQKAQTQNAQIENTQSFNQQEQAQNESSAATVQNESLEQKTQNKNENTQNTNQEAKLQESANQNAQNTAQTLAPAASTPLVKHIDFYDFLNQTKQNAAKNQAPAFKGGGLNAVMAMSHNLENNAAWRLMSTDVGTVAGRVANSRNKYEAGEFLFRDTTSIYFYMFAMPHLASLLGKISGTVPIQADTLECTRAHLIKAVGDKSINPEEFLKQAKTTPENAKDILSKIPFKKDVTTLEEFNTATGNIYAKKARLMSEMQPKLGGKSVLSKQQATDILSTGWVSEPEFLKNAVNKGTYGAAQDPKRFVSRKTTEGLRNSIDVFTQKMAQTAAKKGKNIDADFINSYAKQTVRKNLMFRLCGMAFAIFGLAFLIPKVQYKLTEMRTGSKDFPGTHDYSDKEN